MERRQAAEGRIRKRKVREEAYETNERLHKVSRKLSLLNLGTPPILIFSTCSITDRLLELNGQKLDVPVDNPSQKAAKPKKPSEQPDNDVMQLDNTTDKVYIYNLDDELSESDSSSDEAKLIFLPDMEKHLRNTRIPPSVLANSEGELAGRNLHTDLILYNVPSSLSVPEDRDSVRKAIIETRARAREKQRRENEKARTAYTDLKNGYEEVKPPVELIASFTGVTPAPPFIETEEEDPDAMDID